jgi:hypothetical protein
MGGKGVCVKALHLTDELVPGTLHCYGNSEICLDL